MGNFIEPLESRQLFSTVPAVGTLAGDARVVLADLKALKNLGHSNFLQIEAELKNAGEIKSSGAALRALGLHATAAENSLTKNVTKAGTTVIADVNKLVGAEGRLKKKPTSAPLEKAQASAVAKLQKDASTRLTAINTSIENVASTGKIYAGQLVTLNAGDATLKSTLAATGASSFAARTALGNAVTTTLTTDVAAVIVALTGTPF